MTRSRHTNYSWLAAGVLAAALSASPAIQAREIGFTIENMTNAITFRPFLLAAHSEDAAVFHAGRPAADFSGIQAMAECGGIDELVARLSAAGADVVANPVDQAKPFNPPLGLLFPAGITDGDTVVPFDAGLPGSVSGTIDVSKRNTHFSVVAMLLPTNDAFAGLDSVRIPKKSGTYVYFLPAYDAGTEANDEIPADDNPLDCFPGEPGYPVDPLGNDGTGGSGVASGGNDLDGLDISRAVHIHRNNVGDLDPAGGESDLDARVHRWLNPVVKLTLVVGSRDDDDDDENDD